jgi:RHS repeat-associated protein
LVRKQVDAFFARLADLGSEVKHRCRRDLQAQADKLAAAQSCVQTQHVDLTLVSVYFGGQMIAMRHGSAQPTYLHSDALGSVVATPPLGGSTSALQRYCGYGRLRSAGSGGTWNCGTAANLFDTDRTYTGQQADGTGLMYYHARYYDPAAGQFISPDSLVPDPTHLMDYQRYAYARANPLRYSDPSGHYSVEELMQHFGVSSFQDLLALFGKDGKYAGNSGWYDILRAAQDGDRITATYADNTTALQGTFMRDDRGKIFIDV